ncbi:MAG: ferredoxin [Gemmobacter sp.]|jgi:hypothetical protein|nr:ferredoxin [Gemmobacter sp.]
MSAAEALTLDGIAARAMEHRLDVLGGFNTEDDPGLPPGTRTLLLLGPLEPGFWPLVTTSAEWRDGAPDPMDRWSRRVIGGLARDLGAEALFPFGGPPWHPFFQWAQRSGRAWESPMRLLVHDRTGLFFSCRGALALREHIAPPPPGRYPCEGCPRYCLSACPARALAEGSYEVARCRDWLATPAGENCLAAGCLARRACPISQGHARLPEHSAYHMRQFHK